MKIRIFIMEILSKIIQRIRYGKFKMLGYANIHSSVILESKLNLDRVYPKGIHIGSNTLIASRATILCHEHVKRQQNNPRMPWVTDTFIGKNCFIGIGAMILPGVKIGNEVIVGAATVITHDIPSNSVVVGNPGRIIKNGVRLNEKAILIPNE
jgi:acetyltransferase-like isoleucine patch superfamily enzyme